MSGRSRRTLLFLLVAIAGLTVLPVRTALGAPEVRITVRAAAPGATVELDHPSSHVALRWTGEETDVVELRWRAGGEESAWSAWDSPAISHDVTDDSRGRMATGLVRTEDARAVEVRVVSGSPTAIQVTGIDTEHGPRPVEVVRAEPLAGAAIGKEKLAQPSVVRRSQWGADESIRKSEIEWAPIYRMSVHHTVTPNDDPDPAATIRAIYTWHTQGNGWNDIGYNFVIDASGRIYEGRYAREYDSGEIPTGEDRDGNGVTGAHTGGNNTGTVGIAFLGDFSAPEARPTKAAQDALKRLLAWKADRHDVDPMATTDWTTGQRPTIIGHRDAVATACPGDGLYPLLDGIRQEVAATLAAVRTSLTTTGYWVLGKDTAIYPFGESQAFGPALGGVPAAAPGWSMAPTPTGKGYWVLSATGRVTPYGDAAFHGSTELLRLNAPAVRLEPTRSGKGYWILGQDGGIFSFGDAAFFGSTGDIKLNSPVISMAATPSGKGYWLLAGDGGVFTFGDGAFYGSTGDMKLNAPVVSMAPHPNGRGYWLQATDGGIFSFGAVRFQGSVPGLGLKGTAKTSQIRATPTGNGYYVLGADGGIFTFGDARFHGAQPGLSNGTAAVDLALKTNAPAPTP